MATAETALGMTVEEALRTRRSVRGFTDRRIAPELLTEIFETAQLAPSNCNVQPWHVFVASGAARDRLRAKLIESVKGGVPANPDFLYDNKFADEYRRRQIECAVAMYGAMGIAKDDKAGRMRAGLRNFELFDAPHVAFLGMKKTFPATVAVDVGIYLQTLMLVMTSHGIQSCAQGSMRGYPDLVREEFGFSDEIGIIVGISFGYEDVEVPANKTRTTRLPLGETVHFRD